MVSEIELHHGFFPVPSAIEYGFGTFDGAFDGAFDESVHVCG